MATEINKGEYQFNTGRHYTAGGQVITYKVVDIMVSMGTYYYTVYFFDRSRLITQAVDVIATPNAIPYLEDAIMREYDNCRYTESITIYDYEQAEGETPHSAAEFHRYADSLMA